MARFRKVWAGPLQSWVAVMEARYREVWATEFLPLLLKDASSKKNRDIFFYNVMGLSQDDESDEFCKYDRDPTVISNL
jgi:hypothetical protein